MISRILKSKHVRPIVFFLCSCMALTPMQALGETVRIVPDEEAFGRVESWLDPASHDAWSQDLRDKLSPWASIWTGRRAPFETGAPEHLDPLAEARYTALTQGPAGGSADHQGHQEPAANTGLSEEQLRQLTRTDAIGLDTDAFIRANPLPSPPGVKAGESRFRPPKELIRLMAGKADLDRAPLIPGLNLLSIPEEPADSAPSAVLAPIAGSFTRAYAYENCNPTDKWKLYDPNDAGNSDLTVLDHTKGFWLEADSAVDLPFDGTLPATTTIEICTGWNLIGYPAGQSRHVTNALQSIEGKYVRVFGFDAADPEDPWEVYSVGVPEWGNDLDLMHPGRGYWVLATDNATLEIANEDGPPTIAITAPADLGEITAPTEIRGTVQSKILDRWTVAYRAVGDPDWIELAAGVAPVTDGPLGTFDPTLLLNGMYEIRLEAVDLDGMAVEEVIAVVVEGNMKIGHFTLSFVDLAIPLSGLDLEIIRTYDSRLRHQPGDFGFGWNLDIRQGSYRNNRPPGDGWQISATGGPFGLPCQQVSETKSHLTTVRLSDQEIYQFRLTLKDPAVVVGSCFARAEFELIDGPIPGATLEIIGNDEVIYENSGDRVIDRDSLVVFVPNQVKLTTRDGRVFFLNLESGVTRIEDINGNALDITPEGITHSSGQGVEFIRDSEGRIQEIVDPRNNSNRYSYDGRGDLEMHRNRVGEEMRFTYSEHYLEELLGESNTPVTRSDYDDDGRLIRMTDASGNPIAVEHDMANNREVITNRLGHVRIVEYDSRGNFIRETDELGLVTERQFDDKDRMLWEKDPAGNTTARAYNDGNLTSMTDELGKVTSLSYDGKGNLSRIQDETGVWFNSEFDGKGNLVRSTDGLGNQTIMSYDSRGNLTRKTDAAGKVSTYAYDASGNQVRSVDTLGNATEMDYDAHGNLIKERRFRTLKDGSTETIETQYVMDALDRVVETILPGGAKIETSYNLLGRPVRMIDPLNRATEHVQDLMGRTVRVNAPDGTSVRRGFDAEGRLTGMINARGQETRWTYDFSGRIASMRLPDGSSTSYRYDAAGRVLESTDPSGQTTTFGYDKAGRLISETDALGHTTQYELNARGDVVSTTDALGYKTELIYDAAGRVVEKRFPDGRIELSEFDSLGRLTARVDGAGARTEMSYDSEGRLIEVTDALGGKTRMAYDEVGNQISLTDALGRVTEYEYDARGRLTARELPDGARQTFTYDAAGQLTAMTDFAGQVATYSFDAMGRQTRRNLPGGKTVETTYSATGKPLTITDSRGVTQYTYDGRDRLVTHQAPEGWILRYGWDVNNRQSSRTLDLGTKGQFATSYSYDPLGRVSRIQDFGGGIFELGYDARGSRTSLRYPNGVETSYQYDPAGRVQQIETLGPDALPMDRVTYQYGTAGQPIGMTELDGRVTSWSHDALQRLTSERVEDGLGGLIYENLYGYDAVGNRLSQNRFTAGEPNSESLYSYDSRDRLIQEQIAGLPVASYQWDANGNLTQAQKGTDPSDFQWDFEGRLTGVDLPDGGRISYTYDTAGARMSRRSESSSGETSSSVFATDSSGALSQVVGELDAAGNPRALLTGFDSMMGYSNGTESLFAHNDAIGSTRFLTGSDGTLSDRYRYEAFGSLLDHQGSSQNPYLFTGEPLDRGTGLYYLRARWMMPASGSFASMDPLNGNPAFPRTLNKYLYANAQPNLYVDPEGTFATLPGMMAALGSRATLARGLIVVGRVFKILDNISTIIDTINLIRTIRRFMIAYTSGDPTHVAALLPAAVLNELVLQMATALEYLGPHWDTYKKQAGRSIPAISAASVSYATPRLPTWTKAIKKSRHFRFTLFAPTPPGEREGLDGVGGDTEIPVPGTKYLIMAGRGGGRLYGMGVRRSKNKSSHDQIFRLDYSHGSPPAVTIPDCHYHIGGGGGRTRVDCKK